MPLTFASPDFTIPQPFERDIEIIRDSGNESVIPHNRSLNCTFSVQSAPSSRTFQSLPLCVQNRSAVKREDPPLSTPVDADPLWLTILGHDLVYYAFPIVLAIGIVFSLLALGVFVRMRERRLSHDTYLLWFVTSSLMLLVCAGSMRMSDYIGHANAYQIAYGHVRSVHEWIWYTTIWILIMMSLEKALMVSRRFASFESAPSAAGIAPSPTQATVVSIVIVIVCCISAFPHFFEYETSETFDYASNQTIRTYQLSEDARSYEYATIYFWYTLTISLFLPTPMLVAISILITQELCTKRRKSPVCQHGLQLTTPAHQSTGTGNSCISTRIGAEEMQIARLFVVMVVLYLVLTGPLSVLNGMNGLTPYWTWPETTVYSVVYPLSELSFYTFYVTTLPLLISYSDKFHNTLANVFCCRRDCKRKKQKSVKFNAKTVEIEIYC